MKNPFYRELWCTLPNGDEIFIRRVHRFWERDFDVNCNGVAAEMGIAHHYYIK